LAPELALTIVAESARSIIVYTIPSALLLAHDLLNASPLFGLESTGSLVYACRGNFSLAGIRLQGMMDILLTHFPSHITINAGSQTNRPTHNQILDSFSKRRT
jgi:hypothetical protein